MRYQYIQISIITVVWLTWFLNIGYSQAVELITSYYTIMITMLFGSFVAGSTSLGGGAVAFPVFTKVLSIPSDTSLIFSLAIQSVGMSSATLILLLTRTPIIKKVVLGSIIPGAFGIYIALFYLNDSLPNGQAKYLFSIFSLCVALVLIYDRLINHRKFKTPKPLGFSQDLSLTIITLGSFVGGLISGLIGTGIDFVLFTLMILFSKAGLKQAVTTSVCVMAINAIIGFALIKLLTNNFTGDVINYWLAAIPVVVVGAPLGALACKHFHRDIIFYFLLLLICCCS